MIQRQLKLKLTCAQIQLLETWLWHLTGVWNWAVRKLEADARDGFYSHRYDFTNLLAGHSAKIGLPAHTVREMADTAWVAWERCHKKLAKKPKLKGQRNKLTSIPFPDPFRNPVGNRISIPLVGKVRFHTQEIPAGKIKCGRLIKRASGWHLCIIIDALPNYIPHIADGKIGIDPGFTHLLTLSTGEKIDHPRELERIANRLAQAQRGRRKKLTARLHERLASQRKDRNHKLSRRLVAENAVIRFSKDYLRAVAQRFGKSVASSGHGQLRRFLAYKSTASGRAYDEPASTNSTRMCSTCHALTGPTGLTHLSVRHWCCSMCGTWHDRDVNAAINTRNAGVGITLELCRKVEPGILWR